MQIRRATEDDLDVKNIRLRRYIFEGTETQPNIVR